MQDLLILYIFFAVFMFFIALAGYLWESSMGKYRSPEDVKMFARLAFAAPLWPVFLLGYIYKMWRDAEWMK